VEWSGDEIMPRKWLNLNGKADKVIESLNYLEDDVILIY
jgi:hypothetical protein